MKPWIETLLLRRVHSACVYERDAKSNKFMVLFIGKSQNDDRVIAEELRN